MTAKRGPAGTSGDKPYDEPVDAGDNGSSGDLESKESALRDLQEQERRLTAEIAALRSLQADTSAFDGQLKANREAIDRERQELQTFADTELKGLDAKTKASIVNARKEVEDSAKAAQSKWKEDHDSMTSAADALARDTAELAKAEAAYNRVKQGVADAKRVLGELKAFKKEAQAAEGRNEFAVAGYWLMEIERRLPEAVLKGPDALKASWDELGRKRKAVEGARRGADEAKADEARSRKVRDEAERNRESAILERLKNQTESQQPETAA